MFTAAHPRFSIPAASKAPAPPPAKCGQTAGSPAPGANGKANSAETPVGGDAKGRFSKGNNHGVGNPFARRVAWARKIVLQCVTPEELKAVTKAMLEKAKKGDVAAAKVIFEYTIGKPAKTVNPDQLAREEMNYFKDHSRMLVEASRMVEAVEPWLPLTILRSSWHAFTKKVRKDLVPQLRKGLPGYDLNGQPVTAVNDGKAAPVTESNGCGKTPAQG